MSLLGGVICKRCLAERMNRKKSAPACVLFVGNYDVAFRWWGSYVLLRLK